jgi:glutamate dehydrogenase (NADP+)
MSTYIDNVFEDLTKRNPNQPEFLQAAKEVLTSLGPVIKTRPEYQEASILERLVEPERQIMFRVAWEDDNGKVYVNRGFRVQFNSAIGPYKGGLRFHPNVNLSVIKFLGFEQIFKNALTGLQIGGAKGGSDFDPKGKTNREIERFCQSFMTELYKHIGADTDVPAGDIGVGGREIGYLFGQYKRLTSLFDGGAFTGKASAWGGSLLRPEATGYGAVYFAKIMLEARERDLQDKVCTVSGSGNVAIYTIEKLYQLGAKPITISDTRGTIIQTNGINLQTLKRIKEQERGSLEDYTRAHPDAQYIPISGYKDGRNPVWTVPCYAAFPSATENELKEEDAEELVRNGCICVSEGANMPSTPEAVEVFLKSKISYGPAKAANAGGVAVSGLEMAQNSQRQRWTSERVDDELKGIMQNIYHNANKAAEFYGQPGNLVFGANIASFLRVADAMLAQGRI